MAQPFQIPNFELVACTYTALGALAAYGKLAQSRVRTWALSYIFDAIYGAKKINTSRTVWECLVFVVMGVLVGVAVTQPATPSQALVAGFSWAALLGKFK